MSEKLEPDSKKYRVVVHAEIVFDIEAKNYVAAFDEAVKTIRIEHEGYKHASYR